MTFTVSISGAKIKPPYTKFSDEDNAALKEFEEDIRAAQRKLCDTGLFDVKGYLNRPTGDGDNTTREL